MNKSEAKFFNTSNKMNTAFLKLLEKKEFKDISIIEICNEAGVNRSTFYAHYDNTYDLLQETHSNLIKKFFDDINQTIDVIDIQKASADELIFITPQYLIPYLRFVKNNKLIYKVYNNSNAFATNETDKLLIENIFMPIYEKNGVKDKTIVNYMSKYFLNGINAITMEWVQRDCVDDILLICEIISICVRPAMKFTKD